MKPPDEESLQFCKISRCASASTTWDFFQTSLCCGMTQQRGCFFNEEIWYKAAYNYGTYACHGSGTDKVFVN